MQQEARECREPVAMELDVAREAVSTPDFVIHAKADNECSATGSANGG